MGLPGLPMDQAIDTLGIARKKFPGAPASLDALCRRFGVDNTGRTLHGALLDSELLAEVYLELIGGRQPDFTLDVVAGRDVDMSGQSANGPQERPNPLPSRLTEDERAAHEAFVEKIGATEGWKTYQ